MLDSKSKELALDRIRIASFLGSIVELIPEKVISTGKTLMCYMIHRSDIALGSLWSWKLQVR